MKAKIITHSLINPPETPKIEEHKDFSSRGRKHNMKVIDDDKTNFFKYANPSVFYDSPTGMY